MKKTTKKLALSTETVRRLNRPALAHLIGGAAGTASCASCTVSFCAATSCHTRC